MKEQAEREERKEPRRDLLLILLIIPLGICCMFVAGQAAIKLAPTWDVEADMGSNLDPNVDFSVNTIPELIEPVSSNILTQPVWGDLFLTPNAVIPTRIIPTNIPTLPPQPTTQPTVVIPTNIPTSVPTPTNVILPPPPPPPPPTPPPPIQRANLGITKDDGSTTYIAGAGITYTIVVTSAGPSNAPNFNITDDVPAAITGLTINCTPSGAATCGTNTSSGNTVSFTGASLNDGAGDQITITVSGIVAAGTTGNLTNTASIVIPGNAGFIDPNTGNNSNDDVNIEDPEPDIGPPDGNFYALSDGSSLTINLPTPIVVDGNPDDDIVYYEFSFSPTQVLMDWIQIEISVDGTPGSWYTVFLWGDDIPDTNSNVDIGVIGIPENDNRILLTANLYPYPGSGITINVDNPNPLLGPPPLAGDYYFIRFTAPFGPGNYGNNDGASIDSIEILPYP